MESTVPNGTTLRGRPRLLAFSLIFSTVLFYFSIRECFSPKIVTLGEQAFLFVYSVLIACGYTIGISRVILGSKPPRWLDAWWKRVVACTIGIVALSGLAAMLPLPAFYSNVLRHTVGFLVIPLAMGGKPRLGVARWMDGSPAPPARAASLVRDTEHDIVLHASARKAALLFVAASLFVVGGWWMRLQAPVVAWTCIVFFGLGIPLSALMLVPGFSYLKLERDGFTMRHSWRQYTFGWGEISDLTVVSVAQSSRVAFNVHKPGARRSAMLREMCGRDMMLADNYGLSPSDLCALMQARQAAAARPSA